MKLLPESMKEKASKWDRAALGAFVRVPLLVLEVPLWWWWWLCPNERPFFRAVVERRVCVDVEEFVWAADELLFTSDDDDDDDDDEDDDDEIECDLFDFELWLLSLPWLLLLLLLLLLPLAKESASRGGNGRLRDWVAVVVSIPVALARADGSDDVNEDGDASLKLHNYMWVIYL